ncbi:MAG: SsrA-binding protein SmpB [Candidatus Kerfeldbacteria bacterium]|nr:SsrA-binding protein SmpB [Candidatus Kerfeldbacteria bacterium]
MESIVNKYARSKYEMLESFEAGLVLTGAEVKSVKKGAVNLKSAYIGIEQGELWLKNMHISPYQQANQPGYEPERPRKILLRRSEIATLMGKLQQEGLTLIPEKVYSKHGIVKVNVTLARGLKLHDKRQKIKKRDTERQMQRMMKQKMHS